MVTPFLDPLTVLVVVWFWEEKVRVWVLVWYELDVIVGPVRVTELFCTMLEVCISL